MHKQSQNWPGVQYPLKVRNAPQTQIEHVNVLQAISILNIKSWSEFSEKLKMVFNF